MFFFCILIIFCNLYTKHGPLGEPVHGVHIRVVVEEVDGALVDGEPPEELVVGEVGERAQKGFPLPGGHLRPVGERPKREQDHPATGASYTTIYILYINKI
jgi:hypothetical protein